MRLIRNFGLAFLLMVTIDACFSPPNYPITPQIEYLDIYYGKTNTPGKLDSIVLSLKFKDGDGDLGIDDSYNNIPDFALQFYYSLVNGAIVPHIEGTPYVNFKTKKQNPSLNLPDFVTPYNCTNWEVKRNANNIVIDTVYTKFNPNYFNIFVDFYVNDVKFDASTYFVYPNCSIQGFNGRFPVLSTDPGKKSPLDGKLTYSMQSSNFDGLFSIKQLKVKITIQDRALHKSNEVVTPPFTLQSIRK